MIEQRKAIIWNIINLVYECISTSLVLTEIISRVTMNPIKTENITEQPCVLTGPLWGDSIGDGWIHLTNDQ